MSTKPRAMIRKHRTRSSVLVKDLIPAVILSLFAFPHFTEAAVPLWLDLDNTIQYRPTVDGDINMFPVLQSQAGEYIRGRKFVLGNWSGIAGAKDAELYLHAIDGSGGDRRLYMALDLPIRRPTDPTTADRGHLEIYLDVDRKAGHTCATTDDRKIVVNLFAPQSGMSAVLLNNVDYDYDELGGANGNPCTSTSVPSSATRAHNEAGLGLVIKRNTTTQTYVVELWIDLPVKVVQDRYLGLGIRYEDSDYLLDRAIHNFPNNPTTAPQLKPSWDDLLSWQDIDLAGPYKVPFGVGLWNVGQMQLAPEGDGGEGEPNNIAEGIWQRDIVCLTEVMKASDRADIVEFANHIRENNGLPPFETVVVPPNGNSPNNMILSSWRNITPTTSGDDPFVRFSTLGATSDEDTVFTSGSGAKGIVWARLAPPLPVIGPCVDTAVSGPLCNYPYYDAASFVDIFCTHTQAPRSPLGGNDSFFDHDKFDQRNSQFTVMKTWIDDRRGRVTGGQDGKNRPAIILGDMNTVGPRDLPNNASDHWHMTYWMLAGAQEDIYETPVQYVIEDYVSMRQRLGNWETRQFDKWNKYGTYGYDISAAAGGLGSWIGKGLKAQVGDTVAGSCTQQYPQMDQQVRIDYVMLLPPLALTPEGKEMFPDWSIRKQTLRPTVDIDKHFIDGHGCASDHAEVIAYLDLVYMLDKTGYNPYKSHRVGLKVTQINDIHESDPATKRSFTPRETACRSTSPANLW